VNTPEVETETATLVATGTDLSTLPLQDRVAQGTEWDVPRR
jgi:hypothetical protein